MAQLSFRVTSYFKRKRGEPGLTQLGSQRLTALQALDWVLSAAPEGSFTVDSIVASQVRIIIDRDKFNGEVE